MKTVPSEIHDTETYEDPIPDAGVNIGDFKITKKINPPKFFNNSHNEIECQSSESETLIVCNNELATSFQTIKTDKHKLNPGHYLQKVFFNSVAQKFRSQSLPNSLEKKKFKNTPPSNAIDELNETSVPLVEATDSRPSVEGKEAICESWFKTWPERGIDKVIVHKDDSFTEEKVQTRPTVKSDESNGCQTLSLSNGRSSKTEFSSSDVTSRASNKSFSIRENRSSCCVGLDEIKDCGPNAIGAKPQGNTISLDKLLDNYPLAYSPVTKQLHLISSGPVKSVGVCESNTRPPAQSDKTSDKLNIEKLNLEEIARDKVGCGKGLTGTNPPISLESELSCNILHRVNTEVSSFSSTVSSLSDNSPSTNEDSALGSLLDHGDTCSLVSLGGCSAFSEDSLGEKSKKKTLTGFFSRNVFNWKSGSRSEDSIGWKLFGKSSSPQPSHASLTAEHYAESDGGSLAPDSPCSARSSNSGRLTHCRVASSSALIQLDRPANLPAKSEAEEAKHRQQYQEMLEAARKKELKDAKQRKKQIQTQLRAEEQLAQATRVWTREILPRWDQMHSSKKARELWWQGVPPCVRGKVWRMAISNPLNLTHSLYDICVQRAQDRLRSGDSEGDCGAGESDSDNKEASMQLIQLDISRTFPHLCIFQKGGPYYDMLHCLLAAYVCYRPDVGYVQGMSFIAAVLLLNMEAADAFVCFANLLNRPCHMAFFHLNQPLMQAYYSTYNELFKENLPQLYCHFSATTLTPDLYLLDWIYTVFSKAMSLDLASRVWDVFLRDGEVFLFRTALGILHLCQERLLQMDFVHGSQYLTRLPDDLSPDQLFKSIGCIKTMVGKLTFDDILSLHSSRCQ